MCSSCCWPRLPEHYSPLLCAGSCLRAVCHRISRRAQAVMGCHPTCQTPTHRIPRPNSPMLSLYDKCLLAGLRSTVPRAQKDKKWGDKFGHVHRNICVCCESCYVMEWGVLSCAQVFRYSYFWCDRLQKFKKCAYYLSTRLSVRLLIRNNSTPAEIIFMILYTGGVTKIC
jgi:hypothetical protein